MDILVAEDNATDAELTLRVLKRRSLANNVVWVRDGAEALDFIFHTGAYAALRADERPKLILLDLKMPKVDGLEVLSRIKADARTRMIPVVMMPPLSRTATSSRVTGSA